MSSVILPGSVDPGALSVPICTSAWSEGRTCSAIVAVMETLPPPVAPDLAVACRLIVPVKELAPLVVFGASCTASGGLVAEAVFAGELVAAAPEPAAAQPARAAARAAV